MWVLWRFLVVLGLKDIDVFLLKMKNKKGDTK